MRRIAALICTLIMLCTSAHGEVYAVNYLGGAVSVDDTGAAIIPAGAYDRLYTLRNDDGALTGYAAGKFVSDRLLYAVLDSEGTPLSDHIYTNVVSAGEGCIVYDDSGCRYLSSAHKYDDLVFSAMEYAGDGMLLAVSGNIYDDIGDRVTILWADGISFRTGISMLGSFGSISEGLIPLYDDDAGLYGYINNQGSWIIKPSFKYAGDFKNGLAVIGNTGGYGVIDSSGSIRLTPNSRQCFRSGNIIAMLRGDSLRIYDRDLMLTSVMPLNGAQVRLSGDHIIISGSDSESVYDAYGSLLFSAPSSSQITSVGNGTFIVRSGSWGDRCVRLTWLDGSSLSDDYESIYVLDESMLAYALTDEAGTLRYGLIAHDGTLITEAVYLSVACVTDGMYCADTDVGSVLLDRTGSILNTFKSYTEISQN